MHRAWLHAFLTAALLGCAAERVSDTVVLLPDGSGSHGSLTVTSSGGTRVLDKPFTAAEVTPSGKIATRELDQAEVGKRFGEALASRPPRPVSYTLYFLEGKDELSSDSHPVLERLKETLAGWPSPEISVVGHTDTRGTGDFNDELSLKRALMVRKALLLIGIDGSRVEAVGRGEREPQVPTGDGVAEPRNRRVEITVR